MSSLRDIAPRPQDLAVGRAASSSNDSARPSRVAIACTACRTRRAKCDGARPTCRGCEERDLVCQYGQPTGPQLAQAQKRKIEELEEDKSSLYEVLWYLQTTSPEKASALLQLLRAAQGEDIGGILKQFEQSRSQSVETPAHPTLPRVNRRHRPYSLRQESWITLDYPPFVNITSR
ncbi:hypothetical protein P3342_006591 [Pyrenophora teres f. teres]|nr:hypothetical protein P3342_006591 [Pyrenophora teres f. teres]